MPCRDYDDAPRSRPEDKQKIDELTRLLCKACRLIPDSVLTNVNNQEIANWFRKHDELDLQMLACETMGKLSAREQTALQQHFYQAFKKATLEGAVG